MVSSNVPFGGVKFQNDFEKVLKIFEFSNFKKIKKIFRRPSLPVFKMRALGLEILI